MNQPKPTGIQLFRVTPPVTAIAWSFFTKPPSMPTNVTTATITGHGYHARSTRQQRLLQNLLSMIPLWTTDPCCRQMPELCAVAGYGR